MLKATLASICKEQNINVQNYPVLQNQKNEKENDGGKIMYKTVSQASSIHSSPNKS